jgi:xylulokinase
MAYLMGIDVGTSGLKAVVFDERGRVIASSLRSYEIDRPHEGFAEQNPDAWWEAAKEVIRIAINKSSVEPVEIKGVGLSGQMHSIVLLDRKLELVRPSIIWCDQRTQEQIDEIYKRMSKIRIGRITLNPMATGFSVVSLMWLKKYEPRSFEKISKVLLPKDYLRLRLTGELGTDYSDASGTMLFDTRKMKWAEDILRAAGIEENLLPDVNYSHEICGGITESAGRETGLHTGVPVVYGGGDQSMQAVGNGIVHRGIVSSTIGTGGQILTQTDRPDYDRLFRIHTFCSGANDAWNIVGGTLCAGLSLKWLKNIMFQGYSYDDISDSAEAVSPGSDGLVFLPYLIGERTPHMNPDAKGVFFNVLLRHERSHFARAVMEGVAFSLKDSLEVFKELGVSIDSVIASGGGARSRLWRQIQADVFGREIRVSKSTEQACAGAAMMAAIGCGMCKDLHEACERLVTYDEEVIKPNTNNSRRYNDIYLTYKALYKNNVQLFGKGR